jgi:hypothetical protein
MEQFLKLKSAISTGFEDREQAQLRQFLIRMLNNMSRVR